MNSAAAQASLQYAPDSRLVAGRSPLAQLLHALNQPVTGLQCSMEVTLAMPRTPDQYVRCLRDGLELTERIRALVEALREVADVGEEKSERQETIELKALLRQTVEDLKPVAEVKNVRITLHGAETSAVAVSAGRRTIVGAVFRFLESALSLAARDNGLLVETASDPTQAWFRVRWQRGRASPAFSRPELGLLVARAGFERAGAVWQRERSETFETVTVRLPGLAENRSHP